MRLLVVAGEKCERLMGAGLNALRLEDVERDEIRAHVRKKEGHKTQEQENDDGVGDAYTSHLA